MAAFTPPPPAPQRGDRATFSPRMDLFLNWMGSFAAQLNAFVANLMARDAGGAKTFVYTFDAVTTDADPGPGKLRIGSGTQNAANVLRLDLLADGGANLSALLTSLLAVTSNTKGSIRLVKATDPNAWIIYDVTGGTVLSGYANLTVTARAFSSASPLNAGDSVAVFFDQNGDKGDGGNTPTSQQIRDAVGVLGIANGGTGSNNAAGARANLGAMASNAVIPISQGGTGATNAASAAMQLDVLPASGGTLRGNLTLINTQSLPQVTIAGGNFGKSIRVNANTMEVMNWAYNSVIMSLSDSGVLSAPVITQTSDERKKENWRELTEAQIDAISEINLVGIFDWKDGSGSSVGGSAQEIQKIVPEVVHENAEGELSVDYGGLNFALNHAILRRLKAAK